MGTIFSLINSMSGSTYAKYIGLALVCFWVGMFSGCKYMNTKNLEHTVQMQISVAKKTKSLQDQVNQVTQQSQLKISNDEKKYTELQNDFKQVSSDLDKCVLSNNELQYIYKSANQTMHSTNDGQIGRSLATDAGQPANSVFSCADLGTTTIEHDRMYFECKNRLDALQLVMKKILQQNQN